ncbi:MAG: hypothetical protein OEM40_01530, partial [Acidimicrobiia bacterium]|nr:hypothetical protein [Acidimicrobiia bacterium]
LNMGDLVAFTFEMGHGRSRSSVLLVAQLIYFLGDPSDIFGTVLEGVSLWTWTSTNLPSPPLTV